MLCECVHERAKCFRQRNLSPAGMSCEVNPDFTGATATPTAIDQIPKPTGAAMTACAVFESRPLASLPNPVMTQEQTTQQQFNRAVSRLRQRLLSIYTELAENLPNPNDRKLAWEKANLQIQLEQAKKQQARKLANTKAANDPQ